MKFIRTIFFLKKIYFKQTLLGILFFYGIVLLPLFFAKLIFDSRQDSQKHYENLALSVLLIIYSYFLLRSFIRTIIVNLRLKKSKKTPLFPASQEIMNSAASTELQTLDKARLIRTYENAKLYDALFDFYNHTKQGTYLAKQAYYTIYETKLNRILPNVIFDSKSSKGEQFKYLYLKSQKLSVQGKFDDYFDTLTPQTYYVDSLSFISPEVMEVIIEAKDYDLEIIGDKLLIYAPLIDLSETDFLVNVGNRIAKQINDNIDTYRDDRLSGDQRLNNVTPFGRALLKSPRKFMILLVVSAILIVGMIYLALIFSYQLLYSQIAFLLYLTFGTNLAAIMKLNRENNKITNQFFNQSKDNN